LIFTNIYGPGDKLPSEKELITLFNVSRVPLREALRSLEEMGLITIRPGVSGGAFVAQMGIKSVSDSLFNMIRLGKINISDIWEFRMLIEPNITRLASERRSDWDIQQMEEIISVREKALKARKAPVVSSIDFHQAIARAAKNPLLLLRSSWKSSKGSTSVGAIIKVSLSFTERSLSVSRKGIPKKLGRSCTPT